MTISPAQMDTTEYPPEGQNEEQNLKFTARKYEVRFTPGSIPRQAPTGFGSHAC